MTSTTSDTNTTSDALNLTRDGLTLVTVSPDYFRTGDHHSLMPNGDDNSRTYYATTSRIMGEEWAAIIVNWETDPRGYVGWRTGAEYADLVDPDTHGGWNIRRQYLTPVTRVEEDSQEATTGPEEAAPVFSQEDVDRLVREAREAARREAAAALEEFKETANARAVEYAESNGLCGEFERCMSDIGLMGRDEWREAHQTEYRVEFVVYVDVSANDEDDATERAHTELYESLSYPLDSQFTHHDTSEI